MDGQKQPKLVPDSIMRELFPDDGDEDELFTGKCKKISSWGIG